MRNVLNVMGYCIYIDDLSALDMPNDKTNIINTLNPHSYITAKKDKGFDKALRESDILLPDGSGIVFAAKQLLNKNITKTAGSNLHLHLLNKLNKENGRCFYMGSSSSTLDRIHKKLKSEYPNIEAGFYSPPYKDKFSDDDNDEILNAIAEFKPDVLFVGMTAPKQEKWLHENKNRIDVNIACCIGAVFDFYSGSVQRPSNFWVSNHLEWLPRLLKEPRRLWKRNFVSSPLFLIDVLLYKTWIKKLGRWEDRSEIVSPSSHIRDDKKNNLNNIL